MQPPAAVANALAANAALVEETLDSLLPSSSDLDQPLFKAMRYACLDGGKRLRPFLVMATAKLFDVDESRALRAAAAIEMVHCYSLIHDDLPAIDNDDLRRGRATCHIAFGEATAILAGNALLTLAFAVLADPKTHDSPEVRVDLLRSLAENSGAFGIIGGQMFDLEAEHQQLDLTQVERLQGKKTGALFHFAAEAGAILGCASRQQHKSILAYARNLGLAFQIVDDLLDETGERTIMGKSVGKDAALGKATVPSLIGTKAAKDYTAQLTESACNHLDSFGSRALPLRDLAQFISSRSH